MKVILKKEVDLTGVKTAPGTRLDVTPEFGRELIDLGLADELGPVRKLVEKIEKAVEKKPENRNKNKDN